jgi:hypothetical protein
MENAVGVPPMRVKSGAAKAEEVEAIQAGAEPANASNCLRVIIMILLVSKMKSDRRLIR